MRLIDKDELLEKIKEISRFDDFDVLVVDWDDMIICIDNATTIDAVQVVRCKDCKYCNGEYEDCYFDIFVKPDGYCSYGEKKQK